jgi:endogenous inhibitor of DNA gyrase (YacG/DUF329 family)
MRMYPLRFRYPTHICPECGTASKIEVSAFESLSEENQAAIECPTCSAQVPWVGYGKAAVHAFSLLMKEPMTCSSCGSQDGIPDIYGEDALCQDCMDTLIAEVSGEENVEAAR